MGFGGSLSLSAFFTLYIGAIVFIVGDHTLPTELFFYCWTILHT